LFPEPKPITLRCPFTNMAHITNIKYLSFSFRRNQVAQLALSYCSYRDCQEVSSSLRKNRLADPHDGIWRDWHCWLYEPSNPYETIASKDVCLLIKIIRDAIPARKETVAQRIMECSLSSEGGSTGTNFLSNAFFRLEMFPNQALIRRAPIYHIFVFFHIM
jgi:hypothetical protein